MYPTLNCLFYFLPQNFVQLWHCSEWDFNVLSSWHTATGLCALIPIDCVTLEYEEMDRFLLCFCFPIVFCVACFSSMFVLFLFFVEHFFAVIVILEKYGR